MQPTIDAVDQDEVILNDRDVKPEKKEEPKLTRQQIGQLRRRFFTVVHGRVVVCGHKAKFDTGRQPTNNCISCWDAFFHTSCNLDAIHKFLTTEGAKKFQAKFGNKFTKHFRGFLHKELSKATHQELTEQIPTLGGTFDLGVEQGDIGGSL